MTTTDDRATSGNGMPATKPGMLAGLRVVEMCDEIGEYCGLLLAGLGADVVKVEPPGGSSTRRIGPFLDDRPGPERSLYFWNYNRGKRSVVIDIAAAREQFLSLLEDADILLDSTAGRLNRELGLDRTALQKRYPRLVIARMTPFGDDGPWQNYKASDLVHLALGGVMMNCGYDSEPDGRYDLPPIAPQMWHAYHIAGEQHLVGILGALLHRHHTGEGQDISTAVHEAVAKNTEIDLMTWVMRRSPIFRQTCRHATESPGHIPVIAHTKDGRWYITWLVSLRDEANLVPFLQRYNMAADLKPPDTNMDMTARDVPGSSRTDERKSHIFDVMQRFVRAYTYDNMPWNAAQDAGLLWAPLRKPHENAADDHWIKRGTFTDIAHPEHDRSFRYVTSKWLSTATAWQTGRRAPLLGEDTETIIAELRSARPAATPKLPAAAKPAQPRLSARGRPFALQGIRIFDFSWFLASAGGTRFAAALGAEVIKVEWKQNPDTRLGAMAPVGGRAARNAATAPLPGVGNDPAMGGLFNNKNPGKRGLSLNIRDPRGLDIARRLIKMSDVVCEGFSPGVLDRLGLGYEALKKIRSDIVYVQQSGMGSHGTYGRMRTVGPIAAAFSGISEMSGLPEPVMPAGWGYSYLDWIGAYGFAQAILGALYHRDRTGEGQWIDASQCEAGLFITGTTILDWSANGRIWSRYGNRSPCKPAAPHGAYRCAGADRWIAIACFTDEEWRTLARLAGNGEWLSDGRFSTLAGRLAHQDALDALVTSWTLTQDAFTLMHALQANGVAAGVCQTCADRVDADPQLAALEWLTEINGTKIGTWPLADFPSKLSATPGHVGGLINRGAPAYGEDNAYVLGELLGFSASEQAELAASGVI